MKPKVSKLVQVLKARAKAVSAPHPWPQPSERAAERLRRIISTSLICLGLMLLLVVAGAYGWMHIEQQRLLAQSSMSPAQTVNSPGDESGPVLMYIPKIDLHAAILDGTDRKSLLLAPGHVKNTAWPGDVGNAVVAGHRDTFFRHLHELRKGDDIYVRREGQQFHYLVSRKFLVDPRDVSVTRATTGRQLTLITCYPTYFVGPAPQRLIVVATLSSQSSKPQPTKQAAM